VRDGRLLLKVITLQDKHKLEACIIDERQPTPGPAAFIRRLSGLPRRAAKTHLLCLTKRYLFPLGRICLEISHDTATYRSWGLAYASFFRLLSVNNCLDLVYCSFVSIANGFFFA